MKSSPLNETNLSPFFQPKKKYQFWTKMSLYFLIKIVISFKIHI